jgi:hypothetical protein
MASKFSQTYLQTLALLVTISSVAAGTGAKAEESSTPRIGETTGLRSNEIQQAIHVLTENGVLQTDPLTRETQVNQSVIESLKEKGLLDESASGGGSDCWAPH